MSLTGGCPGLRVYRGENSLLDYEYNSFLTRLLAFGNTVDVEVNDFYAKKLFAQTRSNSTGQTVIYAKTTTKDIKLELENKKIKELEDYKTVDGKAGGTSSFAQLFYTHAYVPFTKEQKGNYLLLARCPWFIKMFRLTAQGRNNALEIACVKGQSDTYSTQLVPKLAKDGTDDVLKRWKAVVADMESARKNAADSGKLIWWQQAVLEEVFIMEIARNLIAPNQVVQSYINGKSFAEYRQVIKVTDMKTGAVDVPAQKQIGIVPEDDTVDVVQLTDIKNVCESLAFQVACYKEETKFWVPFVLAEDDSGVKLSIKKPAESTKYDYLKNLICPDPNQVVNSDPIITHLLDSLNHTGLDALIKKSLAKTTITAKILDIVINTDPYTKDSNTAYTNNYKRDDFLSHIISAEYQNERFVSSILHMKNTLELMRTLDGKGQQQGGGAAVQQQPKTNLGLLAMAEGYRNEVDLASKFMPVYDPYTGSDSVAWDKSMSVLITTTESLPRKREDILKPTELGKACSGIVAPVVKTTMSIPQTTGSVSLKTIGDIPSSSAGSLLQLDISKYADRGLNLLRQLPVSSASRILWSIVKQTAQRNCEDQIVLPGSSGSTIPILPAAVVHTVLTDTARLMWISSRRDNSIYVISPNWQLSNTNKSPGYDKQKLQNAVDVHFAKQNGLMPGCFNFSNIIFSFTELMADSCNESCRDAMYGSNDLSMCRIPAIDPRSVRAYQLKYDMDTLSKQGEVFGKP